GRTCGRTVRCRAAADGRAPEKYERGCPAGSPWHRHAILAYIASPLPTREKSAMSDLTGKYITRGDVTRPWSWRFVIPGETKPRKGTTGTKNKREAEAIAKEERRKALEENARGRQIGLGPMTWGEACDHWLRDVAQYLDEDGLVQKASDAAGRPV